MFKTILLPIDLVDEASWSKALPAALLHARSDGGSLTLLTVIPNFGEGIVGTYFPPDFVDKATADTANNLEAFRAAHISADVPSRTQVRVGTVYDEILRAADEIGVDLIVMGSHRPEFSDYLIGPNAARVVRHARQSVLVVRG